MSHGIKPQRHGKAFFLLNNVQHLVSRAPTKRN